MRFKDLRREAKEVYRARIREYWSMMLKNHGDNITLIARESGVKRTDIYRYFAHYGVERERTRRVHTGNWGNL